MALTITEHVRSVGGTYELEERVYLNEDGELAKPGDEAILLGRKGAKIPRKTAEELGLAKPEPKKAKKPARNKQRKAAPKDK